VKAATVRRGVGGDGMVGKDTCVNQGDLLADKDGVHGPVVPKSRGSRSQSAHSSEEAS
jgi:hypothetical protein